MIADLGLRIADFLRAEFKSEIRNPKSAIVSSSPLQLVSQNIEVVSVRGLDEIECRSALSDADAIIRFHRVADLSVERQNDAFIFFFKLELDHRIIRDDDGPIRQGERTDRRQHDGVHRRINYQPACREVVCGRSGWRRYDQSIGAK